MKKKIFNLEPRPIEAGNKSWIEERLDNAKLELTMKIGKLEKEITEKIMKIEKLENQDSKCDPRQNVLKESAKKLNLNPARYHGGAMEGKSVQDLLKCAKDKSFSILGCIADKPEEKVKFQRALTNLQQVSDLLKDKRFKHFEEEDLEGERLAKRFSSFESHTQRTRPLICVAKDP